jgi:hypothetical protein
MSSVALIAQPSCIDALFGRVTLQVEPGASIAQMIALALPQAEGALRERLRVTIGEHVVLPGLWHAVRPKAGTQVMIRAVPGNDILRNVLTVAVTVGALALGQFYAAGLAEALSVSQGVASALITGTTLLAGTLLINALVPPRTDAKDKPSYAIQGLQNQLTPDGVVPLILGFVRYAPPYAARPYTQAVGDDRFVITSFCCGYGPVSMANWRIGETPIERYSDVNLETRTGYAGDAPLTLYPQQVIEEALSVELQTSQVPTGGPEIRTTAADCTSCEIDTTYPGGVFGADKEGAYVPFTVVVTTRIRLAGSGDAGWSGGPAIVVTAKKPKALTRTTAITFPTRGRYEIELTRTTPDWDEADQSKRDVQKHGRSVWSVLRSIRPEYPIAFDKPLALAACRIRATGQLNGMLDALNADMRSVCPDWDAASGAWIARETNNPASLFRWVLTGPAITYPLDWDEIDAALPDWHAFCFAKGLTYNRVHDYEASVLDVLSDVAAAGRASPQDSGTAWGVVIDRALSVVSAHISPRNSWGFSGERPYVVFPDAFRVSFLDETNSFAKAERVVPWPDFTGDVKVTEKLDLPGITNPDLVWKEARRRQYELIHRPDTYTVNQDFESLTVGRGDRVQLSHDVLDRAQVAARVKGVNGATVVLDELVTFVAGQTYACRFRRDDGTSLLRTVTGYGETSVLSLTGAGDAPGVGNLALFGVSSRESIACTVKGVEAMENFTARLTLIDHAPEIEALVDAEVVPAWSGRAGAEAQTNTGTPLVPTISDVVSGRQAADSASDTNPYPVVVLVTEDGTNTVPIASFQARSRRVGTEAWSVATGTVSSGAVLLSGYAKGDAIEVQSQSISAAAVPSGWSPSFAHTVAATDPAAPSPPQNISLTTPAVGTIRVSVTSSAGATNAATQIYMATGANAVFANATKVGSPIQSGPNTALPPYDIPGLTTGTTYRIWATAFDSDAPPNESAPAGPATIAAT